MTKQRLRAQNAFRQWTRGVSFTLALGKAQVATLVSLDLDRKRVKYNASHPRLARHFHASRGLALRGLAIHYADPIGKHGHYRSRWEITEAGKLVIGLLKTSGVYAEIVADITADVPVLRLVAV